MAQGSKFKVQGLKVFLSYCLFVQIISFALGVLNTSAQKPQNEFSICGGGGLAVFCPQPVSKGFSSMGYASNAGAGFTGFFSPRFGIHTGVEVGFFDVRNSINHFMSVTKKDDCGFYDLHTTVKDYKETHKALFLSIPLMFQFQTKMGYSFNWKKNKKVGYYLMAGAKAQFLINYSYTSQIASFSNAAYYPEFDNWVHSNPILGLGVFNNISATGKLKFGILALTSAETGAKWRIGKNIFLYTGLYFDYGLNEPTQKSRNMSDNFIISLSEEFKNETLLKFTDRINLMTVGIKLRLAFLQPPKKESCNCSR
jgi:hypothetical protein